MNFNDYLKQKITSDPAFKKSFESKDDQFRFDVANLIFEARVHGGLTQEALAKRLKTKQPSIARLEKGSALPSLSFLEKIAKALGTYLIAPRFGFMKIVATETQTINHGPNILSPFDEAYRNIQASIFTSRNVNNKSEVLI